MLKEPPVNTEKDSRILGLGIDKPLAGGNDLCAGIPLAVCPAMQFRTGFFLQQASTTLELPAVAGG